MQNEEIIEIKRPNRNQNFDAKIDYYLTATAATIKLFIKFKIFSLHEGTMHNYV